MHAQPAWLNVTTDPSVCRQINENFLAPICCRSTYQLLEFFRRDAEPDPIGISSSYSVTPHTYFEALLERIAYRKSPCRAAFRFSFRTLALDGGETASSSEIVNIDEHQKSALFHLAIHER